MEVDSIRQSEETAFRSSADACFVSCDEKRLLMEAKAGSHTAFESLVEPYRARIVRMAEGVARSREDAEDVIQQSLYKAFVHLRSFKGNSSFSTWLTRIALNEALMLRRSNKRFHCTSIDDIKTTEDATPALEIPDARPSPEQIYFQRERQRLLLSAMSELRPVMRSALQIRDLEERSASDTARILGVSESAVRSRILRGRRELREKLKGSYAASPGRASRPSCQKGGSQFVSQRIAL